MEEEWNGEDRRSKDKCYDHCFMVKDMLELQAQHKEDSKQQSEVNKNIVKALDTKSPLILVIALIATVAVCTLTSMGYTFTTSANIRNEMAQLLNAQQERITAPLSKIQVELAVTQSRQNDIKALLEKLVKHKETEND